MEELKEALGKMNLEFRMSPISTAMMIQES
jgi:hypothetical protein